MASTAFLAGYAAVMGGAPRFDGLSPFEQGYADEMMRLDRKGQGKPCGRGFISARKKCSPEKSKQLATDLKAGDQAAKSRVAIGKRNAAERQALKRAVQSAKGQKPRVKESTPKSSLSKDANKLKRWLDAEGGMEREMPPEIVVLTEKARKVAISDERKTTADIYKELQKLEKERFAPLENIVNIPGAGHLRQATKQEISEAAKRLNEQREQQRKATIAGILDGTKTVDLGQDVFDLADEAKSDYEALPRTQRKGTEAERIYQQSQQLLSRANEFLDRRSILTGGEDDNWRDELKDVGYSDWEIAAEAESVLRRAAKRK